MTDMPINLKREKLIDRAFLFAFATLLIIAMTGWLVLLGFILWWMLF